MKNMMEKAATIIVDKADTGEAGVVVAAGEVGIIIEAEAGGAADGKTEEGITIIGTIGAVVDGDAVITIIIEAEVIKTVLSSGITLGKVKNNG